MKEPGDGFQDVGRRLLDEREERDQEAGDVDAGAQNPVFVREHDRERQGSVASAVDDLDLPGRGEELEQRRRAVKAVVREIEEKGQAPKRELLSIAEGIAGDTDGGEDSLWSNCVLPALGDLGRIEAEGPSGKWRVVAEE